MVRKITSFMLPNGSLVIMLHRFTLAARGVAGYKVQVGFTSSGCVEIPYVEIPCNCTHAERTRIILQALSKYHDKLTQEIANIGELLHQVSASNCKTDFETCQAS